MKVVLLGGAGYFCRSIITEFSSRLPADYDFVIADYDYRTARKMAKKLGERFSARMVDAAQPRSLEKSLEKASLVVSFVGPWYRFGEPIVEGALRSGKSLVAVNFGSVDVPNKLRERLGGSRVRCVTGISLYPGAVALLAEKLAGRFPGSGEIAFTLEIDTGCCGGLAFVREYFYHLSRGSGIVIPGNIEKRVSMSFKPSGLFQRRAAGGKRGIRTEMLSALQEMVRRKPVPGVSGGVTLSVSCEAGSDTQVRNIHGGMLLTLLSGMLAGASAVALEAGSGGLITLDALAKIPVFMKHVDRDLQELTDPGRNPA